MQKTIISNVTETLQIIILILVYVLLWVSMPALAGDLNSSVPLSSMDTGKMYNPDDDMTTLADVLPEDDFDQDGRTNAQEEADGTDPTDPGSALGLVAYYPFNGNANDESGNGYDGIVNGAVLSDDKFGNPNGAYRFDGVDDWIRVDHDGGLNFDCNNESYTITVSYKVTAADSGGEYKSYSIIQDRYGSNSHISYHIDNYHHHQNHGDSVMANVWTGQASTQYFNTEILDVWHYVSLVNNRNKLILYVDGIKVSETDLPSGSSENNDNTMTIGSVWVAQGILTHWFDGIIDDIRIYNRALSAEEVRALYAFNIPGSQDTDGDGMADGYEQQIIDADPDDDITTITEVLPEDDFDQDGRTNAQEETDGTDPTDPGSTLGLVAYYPFNGNANDESENGYDGIVNGAALTEDRQGDANSAYSFDGDDNIEIQNFGNTSPTSEITVSFWAETMSKGLYSPLILIPDDNSNRFNIHIHYSASADIFWDFGDISSGDGRLRVDDSAKDGLGAWEHYTFISSESENRMQVYINGILDCEIDSHDNFINNDSSLYIGGGSTSKYNFYYTGRLDSIRIYNRSLSKTEIQALYNGSGDINITPGLQPDLVLDTTDVHILNTAGDEIWNPAVGETVIIETTVRNTGAVSATGNMELNVFGGEAPTDLGSYDISAYTLVTSGMIMDSIPAGGTVTIPLSWTISGSDQVASLTVVTEFESNRTQSQANADNGISISMPVAEESFFNNSAGRTLLVGSPPADDYEIDVTVNVPAGMETGIRYTLSGTAVYSWRGDSPVQGAQVSVDVNGENYATRTSAINGEWSVEINALPAGDHTASVEISDGYLTGTEQEILSVTPGPDVCDLRITEIGFDGTGVYRSFRSTAHAVVDGAVILKARVRNDGNVSCGPFNVEFQAPDGSVVCTETVSTLAANTQAWVTASIAWTATPEGSASLDIVVDPIDTISESIENNNTATATVEVRTAKSDLIISDIAGTPATPIKGDSAALTATVRNIGPTTLISGTAFDVGFSIDSSIVDTVRHTLVSDLTTGNEVMIQGTWDTSGDAPGGHSMGVAVDTGSEIDEDYGTNNTRTESITLRDALPNLRLYYLQYGWRHFSGLSFSPAKPTVGDIVTVSNDVYNTGTVAMTAGTLIAVDITVAGLDIGRAQIILANSLAPGAHTTVSLDWDTTGQTPETVTVGAIADPDDTLAEESETDNTTSKALILYPVYADLVVANLEPSTWQPYPDTEIILTVFIRNNGGVDAPGGDVVTFYENSVLAGNEIGIGTLDGPIAAKGGIAAASITWTTPDTAQTVPVFAVVGGSQYQRNVTVTNSPAPDLAIYSEDITFDPPLPNDGDTVSVSATVHNLSGSDAADVPVQFYVDTPAGWVDLGAPVIVGSIVSGNSVTVTASSTITMDYPIYSVKAEAGPDPALGEANPDDNAATSSFTTNNVSVPDAPTMGTVTAGNGQATIAFTPPASDGGSLITGYTVTSSPGGFTGSGTTSPITVTGLDNGTIYTFTVTATNAAGTGEGSAISDSVTPVTVPGVPTIGTVTAGNGEATIAFTPPTSDGGSLITGYTVTSSPGGLTGNGITSPITVTGLTNGTNYIFTVTATNAAGTGEASTASDSVTPVTVPGVPAIGTVTAGNGEATIVFTPPASDGGSPITGYTVTSNPGGLTGSGTTSPITVNGLINGTIYTFTIIATNAVGTGGASTATDSVTPVTVPGAPTIDTVIAGNGQATIAFTPPASDGGSPITGYTVTSNPGGLTGSGTTSPITVTGLTNGTIYTFTVTATNAAGTGEGSAISDSVTPVTVPGVPTIGTVTAGNGEATIAFTPPTSDGGSLITGYTVTSSPGGLTGSGTTSPITVTGLTNGTSYTFTVTATNAAGTGPASAASNSVSLLLVPVANIDANVPTQSVFGGLIELIGTGGPASQAITDYEWTIIKLVNGIEAGTKMIIGTTARFTVNNLPIGTVRVFFRVKNSTGVWSVPDTLDITIADPILYSDLVVGRDNISFLDETGEAVLNPQVGDTITIKVRAQNISLVDSADEVTLKIYDGEVGAGSLIGTVKTPQIKQNSSIMLNLPWQVGYDTDGEPIFGYEEGYKVISVALEYTGNIGFSNENKPFPEVTYANNISTGFLVVGNPIAGDYGITLTGQWASADLYAGYTSTLYGTAAYNWGNLMPVMGANVTIEFSNGDIYNTVTTSPAGGYAVAVVLPIDPGDYTATVSVFDNNLGGNLALNFPVQSPPLPAPPDLVVRKIDFAGDDVYKVGGAIYSPTGSDVTIQAVIYNQGGTTASAPFEIAFYDGNADSGNLLGTAVVNVDLAARSMMTIPCPESWTPGAVDEHIISVEADVNDVVVESNEINNYRNQGIGIRALLPDLCPFYKTYKVISGISFSAEPGVGEVITVFADIYNNGTSNLADDQSFEVVYYDGDPQGGNAIEIGRERVTGPVASGGKVNSSINWDTSLSNVTSGKHMIFVQLDPGNEVSEDFEDNNLTSKSLTIFSETADLLPIDLKFSNYAPLPRTNINLTAIIANHGGTDSNETIVDFYRDDPDTTGTWLGEASCGTVSANGGTQSVSIDWRTPGLDGTVFIYVQVNGRKLARPLTIYLTPPPDLQVFSETITYTPLHPGSVDNIAVSAGITNISESQIANDFKVVFSLDSAAGFVQLGTGVSVSSLAPLADIVVPAPLTFEAVEPYYGIKVEIIPTTLQGDANFQDNTATTSIGIDVPEAAAGSDQIVYINEVIKLDGTQSTASSGLPLRYFWVIKEKPMGSNCEILNPVSAEPTLVTDLPGQYMVELSVSDGKTSDADQIIINCVSPTIADVITGLQILSGVNPDGINTAGTNKIIDINRDGKTGLEDIIYMLRQIVGF